MLVNMRQSVEGSIYVTRPAKRALMGGDLIMQKTTSEKNNNFEHVRVEILYLERGSIAFS